MQVSKCRTAVDRKKDESLAVTPDPLIGPVTTLSAIGGALIIAVVIWLLFRAKPLFEEKAER